MTNRFDLEQQIMACWNIIEDIQLLNKGVLEGRPDGSTMNQDEISNYLLGLESIYALKFEQMFDTFSTMISTRKIIT